MQLPGFLAEPSLSRPQLKALNQGPATPASSSSSLTCRPLLCVSSHSDPLIPYSIRRLTVPPWDLLQLTDPGPWLLSHPPLSYPVTGFTYDVLYALPPYPSSGQFCHPHPNSRLCYQEARLVLTFPFRLLDCV